MLTKVLCENLVFLKITLFEIFALTIILVFNDMTPYQNNGTSLFRAAHFVLEIYCLEKKKCSFFYNFKIAI